MVTNLVIIFNHIYPNLSAMTVVFLYLFEHVWITAIQYYCLQCSAPEDCRHQLYLCDSLKAHTVTKLCTIR